MVRRGSTVRVRQRACKIPEIFGDDMAAVAMVDRLIHHAELISLKATATGSETATSDHARPGPGTPPDRRARRHFAPLAYENGKEVTHHFPFSIYPAQGACGKPRVMPHNRRLRQEPTEMGVAKCVCCCRRMGRAGTSNRWWDSRCSLGHSARRCGCAPPDFAELACVRVPLVPVGQPVRPPVTGAGPPSAAADLPRRAADLVAAQFDTVAAAAEGCDAPVATGVMPTGVWL
jgi:hypothetical protein